MHTIKNNDILQDKGNTWIPLKKVLLVMTSIPKMI